MGLSSTYLVQLLLRRRLLIGEMLYTRHFKKNSGKYKIRFWVRAICSERKQKGEFNMLVKDLRLHDELFFFKYFRISPTIFEEFLTWIPPYIQKQETKMREPTSPTERLCVALGYLVTGNAQVTIAANYRMGPAIVGRIISETCKAIWDERINKVYLDHPNSEHDWLTVAQEFDDRWNFRNTLGAIDGKHVIMQDPARSGSSFFNYKKTHSIVVMAICNARYQFTVVDIVDSGRESDSSVYANSNLGYAIENKQLKLPGEKKLRNSQRILPHVFVGDDAFGLKPHMMKPYPSQNLPIDQRVFNYRLSRTRRIIENVFGICASRFRVLRRPIIASAKKEVLIIKAIVALHKF